MSWKDPFEGLIVDTLRHGDRGRMRLADYSFGSAYLDLEEGVKFKTTIAGLADCLAFVASLAELGIRLWDHDLMQGFGGRCGACVWVTPAVQGRVPEAGLAFESMGLVWSGPNVLAPLTMPPGWRGTQLTGLL